MVLHAHELPSSPEIHSIIERLTWLIDKDSNLWIDAILEVTYSYVTEGDLRYNVSLFSEYAWYDLEWIKNQEGHIEWGKIDFHGIKTLFHNKIERDIKSLNEIKNDLESESSESLATYWLTENHRNMILRTIEDILALLDLTRNSLDFELWKAWYEHWLSTSEVNDRIRKNKTIEEKVFWWDILDRKDESEYTYAYLRRSLAQYNELTPEKKQERVRQKQADRVLDDEELNRLQWYINTIWNKLIDKWFDVEYSEPETEKTSTQQFFERFSWVRIPREQYMQFMQGALELQWLSQKVKVNPNRWAIYDGPTALEIPASEVFESLDFKRVVWLIVHEILAHYINQANHEKWIFAKLRLTGNIEKEEWLAMLLEKIVKWEWFSWIDAINPTFVMVMAGEVLTWDDYKDFIDLYMQISERKTSVEDNFNRRKRNYPDDIVWVQHKDVAYVRGLLRVIKYLKALEEGWFWWKLSDLFTWKVWMEAIEQWLIAFDHEAMLFPILSVEILLFILTSQEETDANRKFRLRHDDFVSYIENKYWLVINQQDTDLLQKARLRPSDLRSTLRLIQPILDSFIEQAWDAIPVHIRQYSEKIKKILNRTNSKSKIITRK